MACFCTSNSASVSTPCSFSWPALELGQLAVHVICWLGRGRCGVGRLLLLVRLLLVGLFLFLVGPPAGLSPRDAVGHAVAVPATTAVRATPRRSPGMSFPSLCGSGDSGLGLRGGLGFGPGLGGIDCGQQSLNRNPSARDQLPTATPKRSGERRRPHVLVDQDARRATRPSTPPASATSPSSSSPEDALEHGEIELAIAIQVGDRHPPNRPVELLLHKHKIEDPDDAPVDQVDQQGQPSPVIRLPGNSTTK